MDTILERIRSLVANGYEIRFRPSTLDGYIAIRLSKENHHVEQIVDMQIPERSFAFKSNEEWFLYNLTSLEFNLDTYIRRFSEEENND